MALTDHTIPLSLAFSFVTNKSVRTGGGKDVIGCLFWANDTFV
jgi:hypothetical protein